MRRGNLEKQGHENRVIYGIDFSGAQDAGHRIWIAKGLPRGKGLVTRACFRAGDLPHSGKHREECLPSLVDLIRSSRHAVMGFDFPFGPSAHQVKGKTGEDFILKFPGMYKSPEAFREKGRQSNPGHELKGKTDIEARTPFSPYNLRMFK